MKISPQPSQAQTLTVSNSVLSSTNVISALPSAAAVTTSTFNLTFLVITVSVVTVVVAAVAIAIAVPLSSKKKNDKNDQTQTLNTEATNLPEISEKYARISPNDSEYTYIPILTTNDIHGFVFPRIININSTIKYNNASLYYFSKYLEIIRKEFGENRVLWLDAGDQQTGGAELETSNNEVLIDFMNTLNITAVTIGNHEYDLDGDKFKINIEKSNFPYIAS